MKPFPFLKAGLICIAIDMVLRLVVLGYWLFSPESTPNLPFLYKGIKYPEIQAMIVAIDLAVVVAAISTSWRTQNLYRIFSYFCIIAAVLVFFIGIFYSRNVGGTEGGLLIASLGFNELRKSWQLSSTA